jgi:hypothetical protein
MFILTFPIFLHDLRPDVTTLPQVAIVSTLENIGASDEKEVQYIKQLCR